jgi:hypothetical protein
MLGSFRYYGAVYSTNGFPSITRIDFGSQTDTPESRQTPNDGKYFRLQKSRVDPENVEFTTIVHEFAHVLYVKQHKDFSGDNVKKFHKALNSLKLKYNKELKALNAEGKQSEIMDMYLGNYASTNLNEFMAEGWTEYNLRKNPSKYAKQIGELIDKYFKK